MFRWNDVKDQEIYDDIVKMYRNPFVPAETFISPIRNWDLDHYAYKYLGSELYMYRILDSNFEAYIEARGDIEQMGSVAIPLSENIDATIL
jgi:hypothetical protein